MGNSQDFQRAEILKSAIESELASTQDAGRRETLQQALNQTESYLEANRGRYETWKEGGVGRSLLHGAAGGLTTGGIGGALGAGGASAAAPYLDQAAENLGPAGKAVVNTAGGAAVGYVLGSNAGAVTGANADWNNRQLHDSEIAKIKRLADTFAKQEKISKAEAEKRLMVQAMRQVDKAYAEVYAGYDQKAEAHLRVNTGTFKADGKTFTEFANMGYYNDPNKFGNQTGYGAERVRLYQNPAYTQSQRDSDLNDKALKTISKGAAKGIANTPSVALNAPIDWVNEFTHSRMGRIQNVPYAYDYDNELEEAIGNQTSSAVINAIGVVSGLKTANSGLVLRYRADRFSTANSRQSAVPRNIQEQIFEKSVRENPLQGTVLVGMNNDSRFPTSAGFQKMEAKMTLTTGEKISIHYQYNRKNGKVYDLKFTNKPFNIQNSNQVFDSLKNIRK
ncbi:hypothetical protein [Neisseria weixii]|uniref:hypothetical protein n=1 Tax=Neisseria weixii TaxID=1853276 RepID=UPI000F506F9F|nr:hypothetical protein [Neisseria weixii]